MQTKEGITWNFEYIDINQALEKIGEYAIFSVDPPWKRCEEKLTHKPSKVFMVESLEKEILDRYVASAKGVEWIVGLGGGIANDAAKYVALRNLAKYVSIPSVVSVNAYLTSKAAVRENGVVIYTGDKFPDLTVIDIPLIRSAPKRLNISGVGDVYSTRTSLLDWAVARDRLNEVYDERVVREAQEVLQTMRNASNDIRDTTSKGVEAIVEAQARITSLQWPFLQKNKIWPEEGSEHIFFYTLENVTGKTFLHGEIVGLGSVISTHMHGGDKSDVISDLDAYGLRFRPADNNISYEVFAKTINNMRRVAHEMNLYFPVLDEYKFKEEEIRDLWKLVN